MQAIQFKEQVLEVIHNLMTDPDSKYFTSRDTMKFVLQDVLREVENIPVDIPETLMKYRVELWEHERGWGVDHFMDVDFNTEKEAVLYREARNAENDLPQAPDYYITAHGPKIVDAIKNPPKK